MIILIYMWTFNSLKLKCDGIMVYVYNINMHVKHSNTACKTLKDVWYDKGTCIPLPFQVLLLFMYYISSKCHIPHNLKSKVG